MLLFSEFILELLLLHIFDNIYSMAMTAPYIGSKISLVSKLSIRYEGILHDVNSRDSTLTLTKGYIKLLIALYFDFSSLIWDRRSPSPAICACS